MTKFKLITMFFFFFQILIYSENSYIAKILTDDNGNILESENPNLKHPLASITKMMTSYIVLDKIEKGEISLNDKVKVSYRAISTGGSNSGLKRNIEVSVEDLLKAVIVRSGNDAAYSLAEFISGSEEEFVKLMNIKAKELGMNDTEFFSSTGLPSSMTKKDLDVSTVNDISKLSVSLVKNTRYLDYSSLSKTQIINGKLTLTNRNNLVGKVSGVEGLKTGHHLEANYNLATCVTRNSLRFFIVIFGAVTENKRDEEVVNYIEYVYSNYHRVKIIEKGDFAIKIPILNAKEKYINLFAAKDVYVLMPQNQKINIYKTAYLPKQISAPLISNEKIGVITLKNKDTVIDEVDLITSEEIKSISAFGKFLRIISFNLF